LSHELAREGAVDTQTIREIEVTERAAAAEVTQQLQEPVEASPPGEATAGQTPQPEEPTP
jgi:hypothetical protein